MNEQQCWQDVISRNGSPAIPFIYAVISTGVFCRPGCPSRLPLRENTRFYKDCNAAANEGYRPCKRCQPLHASPQENAVITTICRAIETAEKAPTLSQLASLANCSPSWLQRTFKATLGITPAKYASALRQQRLYRALQQSDSVTEAAQQSGFPSASRFYEEAASFTAMPPSRHRKGGKGEKIRFGLVRVTLGHTLVAASAQGLCWIALGDDPEYLLEEFQNYFYQAELLEPNAPFSQLLVNVCKQIQAPAQTCSLPLDIRGTAFQHRVWQALRALPPGTTVDYQALAKQIGAPGAARAVAQACAANTLAVVIPCHRVIRKDGSLSGYRWGVERKARLLELERDAGND